MLQMATQAANLLALENRPLVPLLPGRNVPEACHPIAVGRDQAAAIRREGEVADPIGLRREPELFLSLSGIPEANSVIGANGRQQAAVVRRDQQTDRSLAGVP